MVTFYLTQCYPKVKCSHDELYMKLDGCNIVTEEDFLKTFIQFFEIMQLVFSVAHNYSKGCEWWSRGCGVSGEEATTILYYTILLTSAHCAHGYEATL